MANENWLSLTEYSIKHRVSVSTLRRRIKTDKIEYSFDGGKYMIKDLPLHQQRMNKQAQVEQSTAPPQGKIRQELSQEMDIRGSSLDPLRNKDQTSPVLTSANKLLGELKKAYSVILQEKEEQIVQLKDEVVDLRTLVRVLEEQNAQLKSKLSENEISDNWFETIEKF